MCMQFQYLLLIFTIEHFQYLLFLINMLFIFQMIDYFKCINKISINKIWCQFQNDFYIGK